MDTAAITAHLQRASMHEESASQFATDLPHAGWRIVMHFYAALHVLQAYFATKSQRIDPKDHQERWKQINRAPELCSGRGAKFRQVYSRLKQVSEQVRYDEGFPVDQEDLDRAERDLKTVHDFLDPKVSEALGAPRTT